MSQSGTLERVQVQSSNLGLVRLVLNTHLEPTLNLATYEVVRLDAFVRKSKDRSYTARRLG